MEQIDFGKVAEDYRKYRVDFVPRLFQRLCCFEIGLARQRVLDLGAGTGLFGKLLAQRGSKVTFADLSHDLLRQMGLPVSRVVAKAEHLPFEDQSFDVVSVAQCWHWFDRTIAPREILRVLHKGGAVVVVYQTYVPLSGSIAEATEKLILKYQPNWRHANSTGINGQVLRDIQSAGFVQIETFSFDAEIEFAPGAWRGFVRTTSPVGASLSPPQIEQFDEEHQAMLTDWPANLVIPHRVFAAIARSPLSATIMR